MKPQSLHSHEDTLLDFAYGELPASEARAVEDHLSGCTRCTDALSAIRGVRTTMSQLAEEPVPEAGLESLLAYAQQSARRAQLGPAPRATWWRRLLVPVTAAAAFCVVAVIGVQVSKETDLEALADKKAPAAQAPPPPAASLRELSAPVPTEEGALAESELPNAPLAESQNAFGDVVGGSPAKDLAQAQAKKKEAMKSTSRLDYAGSGGGLGSIGDSGLKGASTESKKIGGSSSFGQGRGGGKSDLAREEADDGELFVDNFEKVDRDARKKSAEKSVMKPAGPAPTETLSPTTSTTSKTSTPDAKDAKAREEKRESAPGAGSTAPPPQEQGSSAASGYDEDEPVQRLTLSKPQRRSGGEGSASNSAPAFGSYDAVESVQSDESERAGSRNTSRGSANSQDPGIAPLSEAAWAAYRRGDRAEEARLLRDALARGASGTERAGLLNRLCEAQYALGLSAQAESTCSQVVAEFPNSGAASAARKRMAVEPADKDVPTKARVPAKATTTQH